MKSYIEERAIEIAKYIIEHNATVRQTAKEFGISKSTVHKDVTERLQQIVFSKRSKTGFGYQQAGASYPRWTCHKREIFTYGTPLNGGLYLKK